MINLSTLSVAELKNLQTQIAGDLVRRFGGFIDLSREAQPAGGAVFRDRPAIGGDRNTDLWFPTLDAANAYLVRQAGQGHVDVAENGTMSFDYTHPGCSSSYMETRVVPSQEPVAARTCSSHCGVVTPRDNAGCYRCGLEEPRDRPIEFASGCLYQPNAVELSTGVIVFDACGECEQCGKHGLSKGSACKDGAVIRKATDHEAAQQTIVHETDE